MTDRKQIRPQDIDWMTVKDAAERLLKQAQDTVGYKAPEDWGFYYHHACREMDRLAMALHLVPKE